MSHSIDRRAILKGAAASAVGLASSGSMEALAADDGLRFADPVAFSYDLLKARAAQMAREPYVGPARPAPEIVKQINYEEWGKIRYRMDRALFANGPVEFPVSFFHLGLFFQKAVEMHVVEDGHSRRIIYEQDYFDMPENSVARQLPKGAGFAGLRVQE